MWFQHALHQPADYTAHKPLAAGPHYSSFTERITLIIDIDSIVA